MKKLLFLLLISGLALPFSGFSQLITITVEGMKQGKFKAESVRAKYSDKTEILGYVQETTVPSDNRTGLPTGQRIAQPAILLKAAGASSPQFAQAISTNEMLKKIVIQFYKTDANGMEINYYTVTLENAILVGFKQFYGPLDFEKFNPASNNTLFDEIKVRYQRITMEDKLTGITMTDDAVQRM